MLSSRSCSWFFTGSLQFSLPRLAEQYTDLEHFDSAGPVLLFLPVYGERRRSTASRSSLRGAREAVGRKEGRSRLVTSLSDSGQMHRGLNREFSPVASHVRLHCPANALLPLSVYSGDVEGDVCGSVAKCLSGALSLVYVCGASRRPWTDGLASKEEPTLLRNARGRSALADKFYKMTPARRRGQFARMVLRWLSVKKIGSGCPGSKLYL